LTFRLQCAILSGMKEHTRHEAPEHATSTQDLVTKYEAETNPVTKAVIRSIIEGRLGITERQEQIQKSRNYSIRSYLEKCTYSFDSRRRMRNLFDMWFMK
jgi:hypothetical protein